MKSASDHKAKTEKSYSDNNGADDLQNSVNPFGSSSLTGNELKQIMKGRNKGAMDKDFNGNQTLEGRKESKISAKTQNNIDMNRKFSCLNTNVKNQRSKSFTKSQTQHKK